MNKVLSSLQFPILWRSFIGWIVGETLYKISLKLLVLLFCMFMRLWVEELCFDPLKLSQHSLCLCPYIRHSASGFRGGRFAKGVKFAWWVFHAYASSNYCFPVRLLIHRFTISCQGDLRQSQNAHSIRFGTFCPRVRRCRNLLIRSARVPFGMYSMTMKSLLCLRPS